MTVRINAVDSNMCVISMIYSIRTISGSLRLLSKVSIEYTIINNKLIMNADTDPKLTRESILSNLRYTDLNT